MKWEAKKDFVWGGEPASYELAGSNLTVVLHRVDYTDGWFVHCPEIKFRTALLSTGYVAAQREAVRAVAREVRRMATDADEMLRRFGRGGAGEDG